MIRLIRIIPFRPRTAIFVLNRSSYPANIPNLIVSVIISPVQHQFRRWFRTNMVNEFLKAIEKEFYPATAIILKAFVLGVRASSFCSAISAVFHCPCLAVLSNMTQQCFATEAATASRMPRAQFVADSLPALAATTFAFPDSFPPMIQPHKFNHGEPPELLIRNIYDFLRMYNRFSHAVYASFVNGLVRLGGKFHASYRAAPILAHKLLWETN